MQALLAQRLIVPHRSLIPTTTSPAHNKEHPLRNSKAGEYTFIVSLE
jgi:hypothetical protein